ncbi:MAG: DUF502 domain-containing protein [Syntrophomonas sp.]
MKRITNYFFKGLLFMVPIVLTIYIFFLVFVKIDGLLKIPLPGIGVIPGVGFIATLVIVTLIGFLVSNFLTKKIMFLVDKLLNSLPLVKLLYSSIKDLVGAFVGDKKSFNKPVMVRLSADGSAHVLGFITCESLDNFGMKDYVSVYVPQSYNFAGNLLIFPRDQVQVLDANSSEVMTFIVSGGVAGREE